MSTEFTDSSISSVLKLKHVVFDEITFMRLGFQNKKEKKARLSFGKGVEKIGEGEYRVSLSIKAVRKEEYEATVSISGYFSISEENPFKERILNENAVAILFPYVRAELTLLTAQPETETLTIPVVNINAMFKQAEDKE